MASKKLHIRLLKHNGEENGRWNGYYIVMQEAKSGMKGVVIGKDLESMKAGYDGYKIVSVDLSEEKACEAGKWYVIPGNQRTLVSCTGKVVTRTA